MRKFSDIREARGDTAVFTFGRFNPPTTGHEKLMEAVAGQAKKNVGAPYYIYASHSENVKKDPLPYSKKVAYMKKMFPKHARNIVVDKARNVFEIAVSLHNKGHKAIVMVVGSDRVAEFESLLNKYNGVDARHGYYGFDNIQVISAGERDPDADGVSGMSASKMRAAASENRYENEYDERGKLKKEGFEAGLPDGFNQGMSLFKDVRKHMGIRESFITHQVQQTEEDVVRDMYVEGKIFTIGEEVTDTYTGVTGSIIRRGTNYVTFIAENGTTYKKWLYELELAEDCWAGFKQVGMKKKDGKDVPNCVPVGEKQDKDIKDKKGTQPAKYFAKDAEGDKMAKSTKDKRDAHFNKGKEKSDDDPSAYKPAPGDASAKTKPSKYTNKMKKKFPDLYKEVVDEGAADKSLQKKSDASGISVSILKQVYKRGVAAWRTGHRPGTTPEQWGHARVNSFISGGKTRTTADADLWKQHKGKSEETVLESSRAKRDAMRAMGGRRGVDPADIDDKATDDDIKSASKNIIMQLRKSVSMRGNHSVEFASGKHKVDARIAQAVQDKYMSIKRPADKLAFQNKIATSYKDLLKALGEGFKKDKKLSNLKIATGKNAYLAKDRLDRANKRKTQRQGTPLAASNEDPREIGTDARREMLQAMTPGQKVFKFSEHLDCGTPDCCNECETSSLIESNEYRVGSEKYFEFFQEKRDAYKIGVFNPVGFDKELMEGDIGKYDMYQGEHVPLDCPMMFEEKDVELNKPKVGGPKKYYVYVKDPSTGNVKKVTWGDTTGLKVKLNDKEARKSFAARHDCENAKDKTKASYWACNLPRYAKQLGLSGGGNFFW